MMGLGWLGVTLVVAVVVILLEFAHSFVRIRRLGVRYKLGVPLLYRLPFVLFQMDRLYDLSIDMVEGEKLEQPGHHHHGCFLLDRN
jgi:hypothetical protein